MKYTFKHMGVAGFALATLIGTTSLHAMMPDKQKADAQVEASRSTSKDTRSKRVDRLEQRLTKRGMTADRRDIADALTKNQELLQRSVVVTITSDDGTVSAEWPIVLSANTHWVSAAKKGDFRFSIDRDRVAADVAAKIAEFGPAPVDVTLEKITTDKKGIQKAELSGIASAGFVVDTEKAIDAIIEALESDDSAPVRISLHRRGGAIVNRSGTDLGDLTLLASGLSDFAGSGFGRKSNVRKALNERLNGVVVPAGATFSYNDMLGPVALSLGWQNALVIFNGNQLIPAPGGGVCQVATTLYRAVLQAGFPVVERAPHSLFVSYYEKHGVGIDATIFPGKQDFSFINDTGFPLLIQSYNDGDQAYVNVYGTPDGRRTVLEGPYFSATDPTGAVLGRPIKGNEIAWVQRVTRADGSEQRNVVLSRYSGMPRSLAAKYPVSTIRVQEVSLHAATSAAQ